MLGLAAPHAAAHDLRDFDAKSLDAIRAAHPKQPFVLAFWSVHCAPCLQEMSQWGGLQRKFPDVPILLVATDPPTDRTAVKAVIARTKLYGVQTWVFADEFGERVRFSVDRRWRGELPRTYFYDASHQAEAHSGITETTWLEAWLARQAMRRGGKEKAAR